MPTITTTAVNPGDLITAELMNEILRRLKALEGAAVAVPDVSKAVSLAEVQSALEGNLLHLGLVFNSEGRAIDLNKFHSSRQATDFVTWQIPQPLTSVPPGSLVHIGITLPP
ncbi:MAG TPA: hypothetical protein VH988_09600 [Thermoanaerobaculia bacterium]|jgi:hypothetical protein|nr:hypothetical protein [Thermoanaerobaculia bacterium]